MPSAGIIIVCHGSRGEKAADRLPVTMQAVADGVTALLSRPVAAAWAALQFNHPSLEEAAAVMVAEGVRSIVVMPYFLFAGRHITRDIPEIIETLAGRYPEVEFTMTKAFGEDELFISQVIDCIREVAPGMGTETPLSPNPPGGIEPQSMEIIERLLPLALPVSSDERAVIKRIVHASGDPQIAGSIHFSPTAVSGGTAAMTQGGPIFTDVRMAAAGINATMAGACGCPVFCAMDETDGGNNSWGRSTRTAAAVRWLGPRLNDAIVAIGNAPTALLALLDLIDNDNINPSLVIGMPVGFVQAAASKEALMGHRVPFITVAGTRGGSALAAATVNALLKLALERKQRERPSGINKREP